MVVTVTEPIDYLATSEYGITVFEPSNYKALVRQQAEKRLAAVAKKAKAEAEQDVEEAKEELTEATED